MKTVIALFGSLTLLGSTSVQAQEAWLLEMPKKFGGYLLSKAQAGENATVQEIVGKLPILVEKKTIREIESIKWLKPGKNHQDKSQYNSRGPTDKTERNLYVTTPDGENDYQISSYGELSKSWAPTVVLIKGDQYLILLERDESSAKESVTPTNIRKLSFQGGSPGELTWYSSTPLDGKSLILREVINIKSASRSVPVPFGVRVVCLLNSNRDSSVGLEISSKDASNPDVLLLHHNQALFSKLTQLTGPLKKEVISLKSSDVKDEGEDGSWTLTIEGK